MAPPVHLVVRLTPRGGRDAVDGWATGGEGQAYLKVRVAAAPVEGAANAALVRLLAKALKRPASAVRIVSGEHGRLKHIEVEGAEAADLRRAFGEAPS